MKPKKIKSRNPYAKALRDPVFHQRVVGDGKDYNRAAEKRRTKKELDIQGDDPHVEDGRGET